nr:RluA family pseudouridine synthase [uncultured Tyzzerella sp.]
MQQLNFKILKQDEDKRIDSFLNSSLEDISRSRIQKLIEDNEILVNNKPINKNYKLKENDTILINIEEPKEINILPENIHLNIVYEDNDVILINKPQNMVVHPANGHYSGTLVNALMYHCKDNLSGINGVMRPGIVHRIDKDTSGILIVAKNDKAHQSLASQLENHSMTRVYYAIVYNNLKNDTGTIDAPIGRHPIDRKKMAVTDKNGKRAVTHYEVLKRFKKYTFIKLKLETGRTHQIRVHMSYIGNPLLGDTVYGKEKQPFKLLGQVLHAKVLGFIHPITNEYMEFETELPQYFKEILNKLQ